MTSHIPYERPTEEEMRISRLFERFYREWYIPNIPKLTVDLGVSETTLRQDIISEQFQKKLLEQPRVNEFRYKYDTDGFGLKETYISNIRNAAISSHKPANALKATLESMRIYISAMKESVMIDTRFRNEAMLVSRDGVHTGKECDLCGAPMYVVERGMGYFAGCSTYPECSNPQPLPVEDYIALPMRIEFLNEGTLDELLTTLQPTGTEWRPYTYNEPATKIEFIDPILRSLGWDTYVGSNVGREIKTGNGNADYVLYTDDGEPYAIVEAKKVGTKLDNCSVQLRRYTTGLQTKLGILTNGLDWDIYESDDSGNLEKILSIKDIVSSNESDSITAFSELMSAVA